MRPGMAGLVSGSSSSDVTAGQMVRQVQPRRHGAIAVDLSSGDTLLLGLMSDPGEMGELSHVDSAQTAQANDYLTPWCTSPTVPRSARSSYREVNHSLVTRVHIQRLRGQGMANPQLPVR
jgi:hypothetical protein